MKHSEKIRFWFVVSRDGRRRAGFSPYRRTTSARRLSRPPYSEGPRNEKPETRNSKRILICMPDQPITEPNPSFGAATRRTERWVHLIAWVVAAFGAVNIFEAILPKEPAVLDWMEQFLPMDVSESSRLGMYLAGAFLLAVARGLSRRKRAAWWIAVTLLTVTSLLQLVHAFDYHHTVIAIAIVGILIWRRRDFVALSDRGSIRWALWIGVPLFIAVFLYGVIGLLNLEGQTEGRIDFGSAVLTVLELIFLQSTDTLIATTPRAANFFIHVSVGGIAWGLLVAILFLRPVLQRALEPSVDRELIRRILEQHGCDPLDQFALLPDKRHFVTPDGNTFFAYALWRNFAVALVGPVGPRDQWASSIQEFVRFCLIQDWEPVFYCARGEFRPLFGQAGLKSFKIGEDARLSVAEFSLKGGKFQNLRTACNKARKEGNVCRWYQPLIADRKSAISHEQLTIDYGLEAQMKLLSDAWLRQKGGTEMTFDLGAFGIGQIRENGAAAIFSADGQLEAFATWRPYRQSKGRSLDLMRARADAKGVMDFLIVESIDHFKQQGVEEVSLGNAPLANADEDLRTSVREERVVKFLFENFDRYYGYKSLFEFKRKYQPVWQGRYLGFRPAVNVFLVAAALVRVHLPQGLMKLLRS
jgi:phosphatidylglycerol lysyltransferase